MQNLRIVIGSLGLGGAERHLAQILPALRQRGWHIRVVCLVELGPLTEPLRQAGVTIISPNPRLPISSRWPRKLRQLLTGWCIVQSLIKEYRAHPPMITHFFLPHAYLFGMFAHFWVGNRQPVIMSRRSLNNYAKRYPGISWLETKLHQRATRILGNSQAVVAQLLQEAAPKQAVQLIYNGIDLTPFRQLAPRATVRDQLGIAQDCLVLVIIANLIPYKGHIDLLQALTQCAHLLPKPWHLYCIGKDSGILTELEAFCQNHQLAQQVSFTGPMPPPPRHLFAADICLLTSHEEGFSNAILEAMAASLPVIATDVGGNGEAVQDLQTGLIVPPKQPPLLAEAIVQLANNADLRQQMGSRGRQRVLQHFNLPACVQQYEDLYQHLNDRNA